MSCISESREINSGERELQGSRPATLRVSNSSSTIKKSSHNYPNRSKANPVVIYLRSPKIIHVRPEEFMSLVQRLTGKDSTNEKSYHPSSPSSSSRDMIGDDESMAAMMKKPFNEVDHCYRDQILGMSPTWLSFLASL